MNGWDFGVMWQAGRALLEGRSPYSIEGFFYPLPYAYIMALFALIPQQVAFGLWIAANFALLIFWFRKGFWKWLFYAPMLHLLSSGQNEFVWWSLERMMSTGWRGAIMGALITLKPQTAIILLPYHLLRWARHDRAQLVRWLACTLALWGVPLLWQPTWLADWLHARGSNDFWLSASNTPGIFSLLKITPSLAPVLLVAAAGLVLWAVWTGWRKQKDSRPMMRAILMLAAPLGLFYSTFALLDCAPWWVLVPASLLAVVGTLLVGNFVPWMLLPLVVIGWHLRQRRREASKASSRLENVPSLQVQG
jgi:hypothetical protein